MENTETTLGDRMAAAIDRHLAGLDWNPDCPDLTDDAFRQAYRELSARGIPAQNISDLLERTRSIWEKCSSVFGPVGETDLDRWVWRGQLRGLLIGYFAMREPPGGAGADNSWTGAPSRVRYDDGTWRVFIDEHPHQVKSPVAYRIWKTVQEAGLDYISEAEVFRKMGRKRSKPIHRYRDDLPPDLNDMLIGEAGVGYTIQLPVPPEETLREIF